MSVRKLDKRASTHSRNAPRSQHRNQQKCLESNNNRLNCSQSRLTQVIWKTV